MALSDGDKDGDAERDEDENDVSLKSKDPDELKFARTASPLGVTMHASHDSARKMYIVQSGDTPRSIAVVQLHDHLLEDLIVEINALLFQKIYDVLEGRYVKMLPEGAMILLPNKTDIEQFRARMTEI